MFPDISRAMITIDPTSSGRRNAYRRRAVSSDRVECDKCHADRFVGRDDGPGRRLDLVVTARVESHRPPRDADGGGVLSGDDVRFSICVTEGGSQTERPTPPARTRDTGPRRFPSHPLSMWLTPEAVGRS